MMKEFGVKFYVDRSDGISGLNSYNIHTADKTKVSLEEYFKENNNNIFLIIEDSQDLAFTVTKESEHIFEPKKGDEGRWLRPIGAHYANHNGEQWVSAGIEPNPPEIIMRDNKQFLCLR